MVPLNRIISGEVVQVNKSKQTKIIKPQKKKSQTREEYKMICRRLVGQKVRGP